MEICTYNPRPYLTVCLRYSLSQTVNQEFEVGFPHLVIFKAETDNYSPTNVSLFLFFVGKQFLTIKSPINVTDRHLLPMNVYAGHLTTGKVQLLLLPAGQNM